MFVQGNCTESVIAALPQLKLEQLWKPSRSGFDTDVTLVTQLSLERYAGWHLHKYQAVACSLHFAWHVTMHGKIRTSLFFVTQTASSSETSQHYSCGYNTESLACLRAVLGKPLTCVFAVQSEYAAVTV